MRVCVVCPSWSAFPHTADAETARRRCAAWRDLGHEAHVLCGRDPQPPEYPASKVTDCGIDAHELTLDAPELAINAYPTQDVRRSMEVWVALRELHHHHRFDYIEIPLAGGLPFFSIRARRTLNWAHDALIGVYATERADDTRRRDNDLRYDQQEALVDLMERACIDETDLIAAPSQLALDVLLSRSTPVRDGRIVTVSDPLGIGPKHAADARERMVSTLIAAVETYRAMREDDWSAKDVSDQSLSVIVTVYNLGRYLEDALRSVHDQEHANTEIIIVDDGSTDPLTRRILDSLDTNTYRVIRKPNGGVASARNAGLDAATGTWVLMLDADDELEPGYVTKGLRALATDPGLGFVSPLVRYFSDDEDASLGGWIPYGLHPDDNDILPAFNIAGAGAASIIRRDLIEHAGRYDETWSAYEDWELWCRLAANNIRGTVIPEYLLHYRIRSDSTLRATGLPHHARLKSRLLERASSLITERTARLQFGEALRFRATADSLATARDAASERAARMLEHKDRADALAEQLRNARASIDTIRTNTEDLRNHHEALKGHHAVLRERHDELRKRNEKDVEELKELRQRVNRIESERDQANREKQRLDDIVANLREQTSTMRTTIDELRTRIAELRGKREEAAESLRSTIASLNDRTRSLAESDHTIAELRGRLDGADGEVRRLTDAHERLEVEASELRYHLQSAMQQADHASERQRVLEDELRDMPKVVVRDLLADNVRYRVADRINTALKKLRVQAPVKAMLSRNGTKRPSEDA